MHVGDSVNPKSVCLLPCSTPNPPGPQKAWEDEAPGCHEAAPLSGGVPGEMGFGHLPGQGLSVFLAAVLAGTCHTRLLSDRLQAESGEERQLCRIPQTTAAQA